MKTLVVLSALASIAIAAPALPGEGVTDFKHSEDKFPEAYKREKKSVLSDVNLSTNETPETAVNSPSSQNTDFGATGRSLGLKKPIIIKKKTGYHLYRNSDEEQAQADSQESCTKQVKVKLCDEENNTNTNIMRSSTIEDPNIHMTGNDMKHSIQLAKEAVENLQRDLKKIDQKPSMKSETWKQKEADSDAELHQDIEVARQALEHVQKNFGNLESMSLHATTAKDAENVHNVKFTIAKTEEERMAQWKEALENIHKNVEIARNIEDTFKTVTDQTSFDKNDETDKHTSFHEPMEKNQKQTSENTNSKEVGTCDDDQMLKTKGTSPHESSSQKSTEKEKVVEDDMKTSASTITEAKIPEPLNENMLLETATLRNTPELSNKAQSNAIEKEDTTDSHNQHNRSGNENPLSMKTTEDENEPNQKDESDNKMKSAELDPPLENQKKSIVEHDNIAKESDKIEKKDQLKSAEQVKLTHTNENKEVETQQKTEQGKSAVDEKMLLQSVEQKAKESEEGTPLAKIITQEKSVHDMKSSEHLEKSSTEEKAVENNNLMFAKSADPMSSDTTKSIDLKPVPSTHVEMKLVDNDITDNKHHQLGSPSDMRWAQDKNLDQSAQMKATERLKNDFHDTDHLRNTHSSNHHNTASNGQGFLSHPSSFHDNPMTHGKSAHMDSLTRSNFHMRDAVSEFGPENHMFHWKPPHDTGRSAYGSGSSTGINMGGAAGGGAVGVFPNANVGSCGIPLLLSCAPSVVSGSLAKAHPTGYGAPAYRTEEDFNFHTKRDVKKTNEISPTKVMRTPTNIILKTTTNLDNKH